MLILACIDNYIYYEMLDEIYSQTLTVQLLKFGNG